MSARTWTVQRHAQGAALDIARVTTMLLSLRRLEQLGIVVLMDEMVFEEMLQQLELSPVWGSLSRDLDVTQHKHHVASVGTQLVGRGCMSAEPTEDFTVRITCDQQKGKPSFPGYVFIGFLRPSVFRMGACLADEEGAYTLRPFNGTLYPYRRPTQGTFFINKPYCPGFGCGVVRCVVDRAAATVTFSVNGVSHGVAFRNVDPGPLHAYAQFYYSGLHVELL